jgi:hypothetical protein
LLDRRTVGFILVDGGFKGMVGLALLMLLPRWGASLPATASAVFLYEAVAKLASAYPARRVSSAPAANPWLHLSIGVGIGLCFLCVGLEPLRRALNLVPLERSALAPLAIAVLLTAGSGELVARLLSTRRSPEGTVKPAHG